MARKLKALLLGIGIIAILNLLLFIPGSGFFLVLTLAPLLAGYTCARYESAKNYRNAIVLGIIWSTIQVLIILIIVSSLFPATTPMFGFGEILVFVLIFLCNTGFCVLGNKLA